MTLDQFLSRVSRLPKSNWFLEGAAIRYKRHNGRKRYPGCPVTALCDMHFKDYMKAGKKLGLNGATQDKVTITADFEFDDPFYSPQLRNSLLKATGLNQKEATVNG